MKIYQQRVLPFAKTPLQELVCDIDSYKQFLPYCYDSKIERCNLDGSVVGSLTIKFGPFMKKFTTLNWFDESREVLNLSYVEGPFRQMKGSWIFESLSENETRITFNLNLDFQESFLNQPFKVALEFLYSRIIDSFAQEAHRRYDNCTV